MPNSNSGKKPHVHCNECGANVREDRLRRHLARVHGIRDIETSVGSRSKSPKREPEGKPYVHCPECKQLMASKDFARHFDKFHQYEDKKESSPSSLIQDYPFISLKENDSDPIGIKVIKALHQGQYYIANLTEHCRSCRRRVVFLEVARNTLKAFDVDAKNVIVSTHACDSEERSESLYTVSGGIVDSNRRRH